MSTEPKTLIIALEAAIRADCGFLWYQQWFKPALIIKLYKYYLILAMNGHIFMLQQDSST